MKRESKKALIIKYEKIFSCIYRLIGRNKFHVTKGNKLIVGNAFMKKCSINIQGHNNIVMIESGLTRLSNSHLSILGNNCQIIIGKGSNIKHCYFNIEDDNGQIILKNHVTIHGLTELNVIEGTNIIIGNDCLFSANISFRTGDSHSILDNISGRRINPSANITIGNHVWIGQGVRVLKGVSIGDNSVVAMGSLITKNDFPSNSVIGGIGGKVLKTNIDWTSKRI